MAVVMPRVAGLVKLAVAAAAFSLSLGALAEDTQASTCPAVGIDPRKLYGDEIVFRVFRDGDEVGRHELRFREVADGYRVDVSFDVTVKFLYMTAYQFRHTAVEVWRNGCLESLRATTDDDGDKAVVQASQRGDTIEVVGPDGTWTAPLAIVPTNHWNVAVLNDSAVLNTITGNQDRVQIVDRGPETVVINGQNGKARRYSYSGDLVIDAWYDEGGRWVKMRFLGKDGSTIEYECVRCGAGPSGA